jgi:hypothetical protein
MVKETLTVRNIEQAAAFLELDGQISDGFWENARPYEHWQVWCNATVRVATPGESVGRNFSTRKDNYNFTSPELLECVGQRMLATVRIARRFGIEVAAILEHVCSCAGTVKRETWNEDTFKKAAKLTGMMGDTFFMELESAVADKTYTMKNLKADLKDLKAIIKIRL